MANKKVFTSDIFIGGLPIDVEKDDVEAVFQHMEGFQGLILKDGNRQDKIAFVKFTNGDQADQALQKAMGCLIKNSKPFMRRANTKNKVGTNSELGGGDGPRKNNQWKSSGKNESDNTKTEISRPVSNDPVREETLFMTHVESPCVFWGQVLDAEKNAQLGEMAEKLEVVCPSSPCISGSPDMNKVYAAKYSDDGIWYRCKVIKSLSESRSEVQYVDFGNGEQVENAGIHELPGTLSSTRPFAHRYVLYGLKPIYLDPECMGYQQGRKKLQELIEGKQLTAQVYHGAKGVIPVIISAGDVDVNQEILNCGFADRRFNAPKLSPGGGQMVSPKPKQVPDILPLPPPQCQPVTPQANFHPFPEKKPGLEMPVSNIQSTFFAKPDVSVPPPNFGGFKQIPPNTNETYGFGVTNDPREKSDSMAGNIGTWEDHVNSPPPQKNAQEDVMALSDINKYQSQINTFQQSLSVMIKEQEKSKLMVKSLTSENEMMTLANAQLRGSLKEVEKEKNDTIQECQQFRQTIHDMNGRVKMVEELVRKTKMLRKLFPAKLELHRQGTNGQLFPTDAAVRDNVEYALSLLVDNPDIICTREMEVISALKEAEQMYNQSQDDIRNAKKDTDIDELIAKRDRNRQTLHQCIVTFVEAINNLPVNRRKKHLMEALQALRMSHASFLKPDVRDTLPLKDMVNIYNQWRKKKEVEFMEVRTETNTCHNEVNTALSQIQQQLSLDDFHKDSVESPCGNISIDALLTKFATKLYREIEKTDLERTGDGSFITMALKSIIQAIAVEMADIDSITMLLANYTSLQNFIGCWLDARPDESKLRQVRSSIKTLKSQLRHTLANKEDLEENEETGEELERIKKELSSIRLQLQQQYLEEDTLIGELADQCENHFPEIMHKSPELGIDVIMEYKGLVKQGRSLDQYDISPFSTDSSGLLLSTFNGTPIVLKEYIVDSKFGTSREDFLRRVVAYNTVSCENVLSIDAVFFSKRHAYVQLKYLGQNLEQLYEKESLSQQVIHGVLLGVSKAVDELHQQNIVHGSIHPANVFIHNGEGVLAEYDFTKSMKERGEKIFISKSGLKFVSPETIVRTDVSRSSDQFCVGLLALWLFFPNKSFPCNSSGVYDFSSVDPSHIPKEFLALLENNPGQRADLNWVLQQRYLSNPAPSEQASNIEDDEEDRDNETLQFTLQLRTKSPSKEGNTSPEFPKKGILKKFSASSPNAALDNSSTEDAAENSEADSNIENTELSKEEEKQTVVSDAKNEQLEIINENETLPDVCKISTESENEDKGAESISLVIDENKKENLDSPADVCIENINENETIPDISKISTESENEDKGAESNPVVIDENKKENLGSPVDVCIENANDVLESSNTYLEEQNAGNVEPELGKLLVQSENNDESDLNSNDADLEPLPSDSDLDDSADIPDLD